MRSFIATVILFSLLVGSVAVNAIYVNSVCEKMENLANELKASTEKASLIAELRSLWSKNSAYLNLSIRTDEIERMNDLIESLNASHNAQNDAEFQKYCILIAALAQEFSRYEGISFDSIC